MHTYSFILIEYYNHLSNIAGYLTKFPEKRKLKRYLLGRMAMFEVRKPGRFPLKHGDILETCYNTKWTARNGICETFAAKPYNWGFCSRSCNFEEEMHSPEPGNPYEEMTVYIKDRPPSGTLLTRCNNITSV